MSEEEFYLKEGKLYCQDCLYKAGGGHSAVLCATDFEERGGYCEGCDICNEKIEDFLSKSSKLIQHMNDSPDWKNIDIENSYLFVEVSNPYIHTTIEVNNILKTIVYTSTEITTYVGNARWRWIRSICMKDHTWIGTVGTEWLDEDDNVLKAGWADTRINFYHIY